MKQVTRLCKSKFCRKQQSKQLCHGKWAKPENDPTVVSSTSRYSLQIREKNPPATFWSVLFVSIWWVKPPRWHQPHSFTAVWYLLNPRAVFPVHNLEGFVICQACLNVHALKMFKGFCHTHKALAELPFLKLLLGCSGRGLTFQPPWVSSVCAEEPELSPGMRSLFPLEHRFPGSALWMLRTFQFMHARICACTKFTSFAQGFKA